MKLTKAKKLKALNHAESTGACFWRRFKKDDGTEVANVFVRHNPETGAQWANANAIAAYFKSTNCIEIDRLSGCLIVEVKL